MADELAKDVSNALTLASQAANAANAVYARMLFQAEMREAQLVAALQSSEKMVTALRAEKIVLDDKLLSAEAQLDGAEEKIDELTKQRDEALYDLRALDPIKKKR